ncbi:MAG: hypothetical protein R3B07_21785 [Polyangiaceae bacterium]
MNGRASSGSGAQVHAISPLIGAITVLLSDGRASAIACAGLSQLTGFLTQVLSQGSGCGGRSGTRWLRST